MEKGFIMSNIFNNKIDIDTDVFEENRRHYYFAQTIEIDGRRYPVISVISLAQEDHFETAEDKLKYLITGTKN